MIREYRKNKKWKQINYRSVISALGTEFLFDLYNRYYPDVNSLRFRNTITCCKGTEITTYAPQEEWNFIARWFGEKFIRGDEDIWNELDRYIEDPKERLFRMINKINKTNIQELDDIGLGLLLIDFHYTVLTVIYKINLVQIEHALSYAIDSMCKKYFSNEQERCIAIASLLYSEESTIGVSEEKDFLELILNCMKNNSNSVYDVIKKHHDKYKYVHSAYGANAYTHNYYIKRYNRLSEKGCEEIEKKLTELNEKTNSMIIEKNTYLEKIQDNKILLKNIEFSRRVGVLRDKNKALLGKTTEIRENILKEISNRKNIPMKILNYYFLSELCDLLSDNKVLKKSIIGERKRGLVLYRKEFFTTKTDEAYKELIYDRKMKSDNISGVCASSGRVFGVVKIIKSSKDINKINRGEIMVAHGTDFDLINAMQIAGGIITEEGGILSHAAVISRELRIPCLIGVENITKLLKDGMHVELNADRGTIKIKNNKNGKIIFLRHFKPNIDKNKPVAEWELDEEGQRAMDNMIKSNKLKSIDKIFTSPEPKARITADIIGKKYNIPVVDCHEISEVDRSKAGFIEEDYIEIVKSYLTNSPEFRYEWENIDNVKRRIRKFIKRINAEKNTIFVISHGMFLSILLHRYFSENIINFWKDLKFGQILEVDKNRLIEMWKNDRIY